MLLPTTSIDTFFACTILIAAVLIATACVTSTIQTTITNTQDINKESYLNAIANRIISSPGTPTNWGSSNNIPSDFGLATSSSSSIPFELDMDKVTRLNSQNNASLSYIDMLNATCLNNIAMGITVSQIMSINIEQSSNSTVGNETYFTFTILTSIESEPTSATLQCYVIADNYLSNITGSTSDVGLGYITVQMTSEAKANAMLIVFARASFDDRLTSYAIYNFVNSTQEQSPSNDMLTLSPLNYMLSITTNSSDLTVQNGYVFSYSTDQSLVYMKNSAEWSIPNIIDTSPFIVVACGQNNSTYFQEWVAYPQIPFNAGSSFTGSEQNVFSYTVTINGALYKINVSFGDVSP